MNLLNKLLTITLAALSGSAAMADDYEAQSVTISTTDKGSANLTLVGTTAAGCQVWSCSNNAVAGGSGTTWSIDGGTAISASEGTFVPTYPIVSTQLGTKYDNAKLRKLSDQTTPELYHFVKVNSQTSADFFVWNRTDMGQGKIEDFILTPTVTLTGSDAASSTTDHSQSTHTVSWTVTGLTSDAIDHLTLKWSYNGGRTWEADSVCNLGGATNSYTVAHPLTQDTVRYQISLYPKSQYRIVTDKSLWQSAVTKDYDISCTNRVVYNATSAKKVSYTTVGDARAKDINFLGVTQDGHQIWGYQGDSENTFTHWEVDGNRLSYNTDFFNAQTEYPLTTNFSSLSTGPKRRTQSGSQYYHFVKVNASDEANYVCCAYDAGTNFKQTDFLIDAKPTVKPASGFTYNANDVNICQDIDWAVKNLNGLTLDSVTVSFSCNGGKDWKWGQSITSFPDQENSGKVSVTTLPIEVSRVRYRLTLHVKNDYKAVCGDYTAETPDLVVNLPKGDLNKMAVYTRVYSEDELEAGGTYLIVYYTDDGQCKTLGKHGTDYHRKPQSLTLFHNKVKATEVQLSSAAYSTGGVSVHELKLGGEAGKWTLLDRMSHKYLCASSGTDDKKYYLDQESEADENAQASIVFTNGEAVVTFGGDNKNNILAYHTYNNSNYFYCGNSAELQVYGGKRYMRIYRKRSIFPITSVGYATFYTDEAYTMPTGVTGYTVTRNDDNESIQLNALYPAGTLVPARTPLLLKGAEGDYDILQTLSDDAAPTANLLHGTTAAESTYIQGAAAYYKLSKGTDGKAGFYYGAKDGGAFVNAPNKAYLALSATEAESIQRGFAFDLDDDTIADIPSAIEQPKARTAKAIYDLNGRRLATLKGAQKGVYIVDGKKVLVK